MSLKSRFRRAAALFDKSAWLLMLPTFALLFIDPPLFRTLITWSFYGVSIAGVSIIISRLTFPQFHFDDLYDAVKSGNVAAAILLAAVVFFVGLVMISLVLWSKA